MTFLCLMFILAAFTYAAENPKHVFAHFIVSILRVIYNKAN